MVSPVDAAPTQPTAPAPRRRRWRRWLGATTAVLLVAATAALAVHWEMQHSTLQAHYMSEWAAQLRYELQPGSSEGNRYPKAGPYDERLGYTRIPGFIARLNARNHPIAEQARQSSTLAEYIERGFFAPFPEKNQAGLQVYDCRGDALYRSGYPMHVYPDIASIPPLIMQALAFIENREVLDSPASTHNPAVEWDRLGRAVIDQFRSAIDPDHPAAGGSTLATQLEKFRHSPEGRTADVHAKYLQIVSATVRAYRDGTSTDAARTRILLDYINGLPLGAMRGFGEINGVLDGLHAWYGADVDASNRALRLSAEQVRSDATARAAQALAFRRVLSLFIAQRRPAYFFASGKARLAALTDSYIRLLAQGGVIEPVLAEAALKAPLKIASSYAIDDDSDRAATIRDRKAANLVRTEIASMLDVTSWYELDRLDVRARSSIDGKLQTAISELLARLQQPGEAKAAGLVGRQLLEYGDPAKLYYSFTLYERAEGVNLLRVQTDNLDQPFDINTGAKLELGSTAKLRTLVNYLEIVANLHARLAGLDRRQLDAYKVGKRDRLTQWAIAHLRSARDRSLPAMLEAAMDRRYSANPGETFFTGGGAHRFANFSSSDNHKYPDLREALRDSVNLVFIRLMRDIVYHHMYGEPNSAARILEDHSHPDREALLQRFADREGAQFTRGFYRRLRGKTPPQMLDALVSGIQPTPVRLAVIFRSVRPDSSLQEFSRFLRAQLPSSRLDDDDLASLYARYAIDAFSLPDRGYLARVHPLELWVAHQLHMHPQATMSEVLAAGAPQRQDVYGWLFRTRAKAAQNRRIQSLLEIDAFAEIARSWQRLGYPFERLVPSYATSIGSSGDRPAALAELMGIIINGGVRQPTVQISAVRLAEGTPYEVRTRRNRLGAERVMASEVAATLHNALRLVVAEGTAKRLDSALDGGEESIEIGGKTGTGDNRLNTYSARGHQTGSKVVNRTATFVFYIGDRHFGTITAYVPGPAAERFRFTSALPVSIVKLMAPLLEPAVRSNSSSACPAIDEGHMVAAAPIHAPTMLPTLPPAVQPAGLAASANAIARTSGSAVLAPAR